MFVGKSSATATVPTLSQIPRPGPGIKSCRFRGVSMLGERGERSYTRTCSCVSMNSTRLAGLGLLFVLLLFVVGVVKPGAAT